MQADPSPTDDGRTATVGDRIIRWGLIAGAVTAIIGLGVLAWNLLNPDPTPTLDGRFEDLVIEHGVTFGDFKSHLEFAGGGAVADVALVRAAIARATVVAQDDPTATATATSTASSTATATPTSTATATATATSTADPVAGKVGLRAASNAGELILTPPANAHTEETTVALPRECEFRGGSGEGEVACDGAGSVSWAAAQKGEPLSGTNPGAEPAAVSAARFLRVLRSTRLRTRIRDGKKTTDPLGVTVSLEAVVEGYRDKEVDVRWSLHRAGSGKRSTRDWLANRLVFKRKVRADEERISADFWVPLPRSRARSFIRVGLYDPEQQQRIARRDTERFK